MTDLSVFTPLTTVVGPPSPSQSPTVRLSSSKSSHPGRLEEPVSSAGPELEIVTSSLLALISTSLGGRVQSRAPVRPLTTSLSLIRFNTEEFSIEANHHNIVLINHLSLRVDLYSPDTGDLVGGFHLMNSASPRCSDLTGRLLCVGFKQNIEVWDLEDIIISCQCLGF